MSKSTPQTGAALIVRGVRDVRLTTRDEDGALSSSSVTYPASQLSGALEGEDGWVELSSENNRREGVVEFINSAEGRVGRPANTGRTVGALDDWSSLLSENPTPALDAPVRPAQPRRPQTYLEAMTHPGALPAEFHLGLIPATPLYLANLAKEDAMKLKLNPDGTDTLQCPECETVVSPADNVVPDPQPGDPCPACVETPDPLVFGPRPSAASVPTLYGEPSGGFVVDTAPNRFSDQSSACNVKVSYDETFEPGQVPSDLLERIAAASAAEFPPFVRPLDVGYNGPVEMDTMSFFPDARRDDDAPAYEPEYRGHRDGGVYRVGQEGGKLVDTAAWGKIPNNADYFPPAPSYRPDAEEFPAGDPRITPPPPQHSVPGGFAAQVTKTVVERGSAYGTPADNHQVTAEIFNTWLSRRLGLAIKLTAEDVCMLNVLQKAARLACTSKDDSWLDIAGYTENVAMLRPEQRNTK